MSLPSEINPHLLATNTGYNIDKSLRFRRSAGAFLNRTPAGAGNVQIMTLSFWFKRGTLGVAQYIFGSYLSGSFFSNIYIESTNQIGFVDIASSTNLLSTQVFRDPSAWYHIVVAFDTTQATAANRVKFYVNGVQITAFAASTYPAQNTNLNLNNYVNHTLFNNAAPGGTLYTDGYLAEVNFIDGQALTPSSFGSFNATTGVWQPARYTGSYGTNGFYLPFTDNSALTTSSNVGIGKDFSGNGNYWTTNNISLTAGVTYDSMTDVPTLTSATAANFAVLNPLRPTASGAFSNGNLTGTAETGTPARGLCSTIVLPYTGKWYAEVVFASHINNWCGVTANDFLAADLNTAGQQSVLYYATNGTKWVNGSNSAYGASYTTETIGIAFDGAAGTITFYKSNVSQGAITLPSSTVQYVFVQGNAAGAAIAANWNFGQRPFTYTPPTGYVALNTFNLPNSTIVKGNTVMDATLYSGNSNATQTIVNAAGFKPDAVWLKSRSNVDSWGQVDSVRGVNKLLKSDATNAEITAGSVTAFNSNGFTADLNFNVSGRTYIGYQWQAGQGTTSSNTSGSITSTVSVNASAGFSVVTWTYNSSGGTVGHGLGVAPQWIIQKDRTNGTYSWDVYHISLGATKRLSLNNTNASQSQIVWNNTTPTSSVFSSGASWYTNADSMVSYCWTPIAGYSAFGSYTGNGSDNGPFVYTGFLPKYVLIKRTDAADQWMLHDTGRNPSNTMTSSLYLNLANAEDQSWLVDSLSNGFKVRSGGSTAMNVNGGTYIYICYAENPFKNSLAR